MGSSGMTTLKRPDDWWSLWHAVNRNESGAVKDDIARWAERDPSTFRPDRLDLCITDDTQRPYRYTLPPMWVHITRDCRWMTQEPDRAARVTPGWYRTPPVTLALKPPDVPTDLDFRHMYIYAKLDTAVRRPRSILLTPMPTLLMMDNIYGDDTLCLGRLGSGVDTDDLHPRKGWPGFAGSENIPTPAMVAGLWRRFVMSKAAADLVYDAAQSAHIMRRMGLDAVADLLERGDAVEAYQNEHCMYWFFNAQRCAIAAWNKSRTDPDEEAGDEPDERRKAVLDGFWSTFWGGGDQYKMMNELHLTKAIRDAVDEAARDPRLAGRVARTTGMILRVHPGVQELQRHVASVQEPGRITRMAARLAHEAFDGLPAGMVVDGRSLMRVLADTSLLRTGYMVIDVNVEAPDGQ